MLREQTPAWALSYDGWQPDDEPTREALTTLGNGHFATRGAGEEARAGGARYPGTYLSGGYNRRASQVHGHMVVNEDLVNWPNWLPLAIRIDGGDWIDPCRLELLAYRQTLRLRDGVLCRQLRFRDDHGRTTELESRRLVHMGDPHAAAIWWQLTALDWSGPVELRSAIDGAVTNDGVARYRALESRHLEVIDREAVSDEAIVLVSRATQSHIVMAQAVRTRVWRDDQRLVRDRSVATSDDAIAQHVHFVCAPHQPVRIEKVLALYTSRDLAISEPKIEASTNVLRLDDFASLYRSHALAWKRLWHAADLRIDDARVEVQRIVRLHVFNLLQVASLHTIDRDAGIPARGLHGEAYRGHVFWDELFIFPFLTLRFPEITRSLIMYRHRRLREARQAARVAGYQGALFPWQSGSNGREETQVLHLNPHSMRWVPDETHLQRHVNAAIAYNVWRYFQVSGDMQFLSYHGAELLLEIARLWASVARYDPARGRYVICGVVGPDEFHTRYPGSDQPGLDNNAYTNVMAAWTLRTARRALAMLPPDRRAQLSEALGIDRAQLERWRDICCRMFVPFHGDGIISQFEGWDALEELDWDGLRRAHGDIKRLDRILEAAGDDVNRYKASKQADALMLLFVLSSDELRSLLGDMGYPLAPEAIPRMVDHYLQRTSHGSSLSAVVHAWVLARSDRRASLRLFCDALMTDVTDMQGGTTAEGIHLGAMAGTVDLLQRCYTGLEIRGDALYFNPSLPEGIGRLRLRMQYQGQWLELEATDDRLIVSLDAASPRALHIGDVHGIRRLEPGSRQVLVRAVHGRSS